MSYKVNVTGLCAAMGIANPIAEEDVFIERLIFRGENDDVHIVEATDMNRAGRLLIESFATNFSEEDRTTVTRSNGFSYSKSFKQAAEEFFDEIWNNLSPTHRSLLYGIATYNKVDIVWKENAPSF